MATRSRIGIKYSNGSIHSVYCHSDGYYSHNGRILHEHYQCLDKVKQLIALGSLSSLGELIGEKHNMDWRFDSQFETLGGRIDWEKIRQDPRSLWCRAFGRDRGDVNTGATIVKHLSDMDSLLEEYLYLFDVDRNSWIACETPFHNNVLDLDWYLLSDIAKAGYDNICPKYAIAPSGKDEDRVHIRTVNFDAFDGIFDPAAPNFDDFAMF